jgi:hypothetical protein
MFTVQHRSFIIAVILTALTALSVHAQTNIGGVVNSYFRVNAVYPCDSTVTVDDAKGLYVGDLVFLVQMQGATLRGTTDSTFGDVIDTGCAGCGEYITIGSISGNDITFTSRMVHPYSASGSVQIVRVARYARARIVTPVFARPWDGATGGVVAIDASDTLIFGSDIMVSGMGFRGGDTNDFDTECGVTAWVLEKNSRWAGRKGEGVAILSDAVASGRAYASNGGGGGNGNNAGGAGGGNGGAGGGGGDANMHCKPLDIVGGWGGRTMNTTAEQQRFFLGGGGGAGHQNDRLGTGGTAGGGLVLLRARAVKGYGSNIFANGGTHRVGARRDGAGGGGAGGTVMIETDSVHSPLTVHTNGARGGDCSNEYNAHGPGGGGGGGVIILNALHTNIVPAVNGGDPGTHTFASNEAYGQNRRAARGDDGTVRIGTKWRAARQIALSVTADTVFCPGDSATFTASEGFASYRWSNGVTSRIMRTGVAGRYSVVAIDSGGCAYPSREYEAIDNTVRIAAPQLIDYGKCEYQRRVRRLFQIENRDNDPLLIERFTVPNGFVLEEPSMPVVIPRGQTIGCTVAFLAPEDRPYLDTLIAHIVAPCTTDVRIVLMANIEPVTIEFSAANVRVKVGTEGVRLPVTMDARIRQQDLTQTTMELTLVMDPKMFAPQVVTQGAVVRDLLDFVGRTREITIRFTDIDIRSERTTLTEIIGTVLATDTLYSVVDLKSVAFQKVTQNPDVILNDGSLTVDPACFQEGQLVTFAPIPTLEIFPQPSYGDVTITCSTSLSGWNMLEVVDPAGRTMRTERFMADQGETHVMQLTDLATGVYVVRFTHGMGVLTKTIVVIE